MCGICGELIFDLSTPPTRELVGSMLEAIHHRGPDDEGVYLSGRVALGHRRLSIIDLSSGHQPLSNEDGTVWIVFNGEIYNYQELASDLKSKGHIFRTKSDTEVIVHLYEEYGESCVEKLRGMFAFALWDSRKDTLLLVRDRVGIKPLYYWHGEKGIVFGSEIKAILADPDVDREINFSAIGKFLMFYFLPGEETLFKRIRKLLPGHYMTVRGDKISIRQYWDLRFDKSDIPLRAAEERTRELLEEAVRLHMISDVPVGCLLSGGIDSTAMLGFSVGKSEFPLSSYTLGFSERVEADERPYARLAAERYGSMHHEMTISPQQFQDFMPRYVWHMEEPVCEPQAVALYYVSKLASEYVKVLISGEGGDEAFGGYHIYRNVLWLERVKRLSRPFNGIASQGLAWANRFLHSHKVNKYGPLLGTDFTSYYLGRTFNPGMFFNSHLRDLCTTDFLSHLNKRESLSAAKAYVENGSAQGILDRMLYVDTKTSLPDDLLLKADKMTMANSVELRVPFLDHKILEFAASLPESYKIRRFTTKYVAKRALQDLLPREILKRRKVGFPVPYDSWLRSELYSWVRDILLDSKTVSRGYFQKGCLEKLISDHAQHGRYPKEILSLVSLELWHRTMLSPAGARPVAPLTATGK